MKDPIQILAVLAHLGKMERELMRRHHIRLRVDKVTPDGHSALCSAAQVRTLFFRGDHKTFEGVEACHIALSSLHLIGLSPLIGWLPREKFGPFMKIDPKDPFQIGQALRDAGLEHFLLPAKPPITPVLRVQRHG